MKFAPNYDRDTQGRIKFPTNDQELRKIYFIDEVFTHPAKANLYMVDALISYTSVKGQTIMDITAGTGSILLGTTSGRRVICIELQKQYAEWIQMSYDNMIAAHQPAMAPVILQGMCQAFLPIPCDSIIFSPPYAGGLNRTGGILSREAIGNQVGQYSYEEGNLGHLNDFMFGQEMRKIYTLCFESLRSGGYLSIIIKDRMKQGKRIDLGIQALRAMRQAGFELDSWHTWTPPGLMFLKIHKSRGTRVEEDEHIIIVRKP
jgi:hypothetical protein